MCVCVCVCVCVCERERERERERESHNTLEKKLKARLVDCNRHCNVIVILMVSLFNCLVIFLLQGIVIPYE